MYILYSLAAALICMIAYRYSSAAIDTMVGGIQRPWLRLTLTATLKGLAFLTTFALAVISIVFIIVQASASGQKKG